MHAQLVGNVPDAMEVNRATYVESGQNTCIFPGFCRKSIGRTAHLDDRPAPPPIIAKPSYQPQSAKPAP